MSSGESGFTVTLDASPVRTPAGALLELSGEGLARAVAEEWQAQGDDILPHTMPLTTLACTAIDRVGPRRAEVIDEALKYAGADLLCYRAEDPPELAERQRRCWQPVLDWVRQAHGAELRVTTGIVHVAQSPEVVEPLRRTLEACQDLELTALFTVTAASGSLVIALALAAGRIDADEACQLSQLDEGFQNERWGEDAEAMTRRGNIQQEIHAAATFLYLTRE